MAAHTYHPAITVTRLHFHEEQSDASSGRAGTGGPEATGQLYEDVHIGIRLRKADANLPERHLDARRDLEQFLSKRPHLS